MRRIVRQNRCSEHACMHSCVRVCVCVGACLGVRVIVYRGLVCIGLPDARIFTGLSGILALCSE